MRVYEFAKEVGQSSKDILSLLEKGGFDLGSHMSVLTDEALAYLKKKHTAKVAVQPKKVAKKEATIKKAPTSKVVQAKPMQQKKLTPKPSDSTPPTSSTPQAKVISKPVRAKPATPSKRPMSPRAKAAAKKSRRFAARKERRAATIPKEVSEITIKSELPLFKVAEMMGKHDSDIILALLKRGMPCSRNRILDIQTIESLGPTFDIEVIVEKPKDASEGGELVVAEKKDLQTRWPIAVVMGHVDHGKTTLLDYIRQHNVAAREKGGITQHLGAYEVDSSHGKIVFLDTPGHEAFSYMRKRGARVTDIAILVVAADDGIKPQTLEAIKHAKNADVPIIVAINKIDKVENRVVAVEGVKRQLAEQDLLPEDWGGDIVCVPISAVTGEGVDDLLEMIVLQSELNELQANPNADAQAFILESHLEKGFGPVATVISLEGTLKRGDYFVCGSSTGRVRLLINSAGQKITQAGPSIPVQVVGFDQFVSLGDWLKVVTQKEYAKARASKSSVISSISAPQQSFSTAGSVEKKPINIILKTDTQGSSQAILGSLKDLEKKNKKIPAFFQIVQKGIGNISESDVEFALDTRSIVVGLHVKVEKNALMSAKAKKVEVFTNQIIYKLLEDLEKVLIRHRQTRIIRKKVADAIVRKVFDVKGLGVIAGCYVQEGVIPRKCVVVCVRDGQKIGEGAITSLQREKKSVKEVHSGFECGFIVPDFGEWQEGDSVEVYVEEKELI